MADVTIFSGRHRFLSNFYPSLLMIDGIIFQSAEHAYQAAKSTDPVMKQLIAQCATASAAKLIGQRVLMRPGWEGIKEREMERILRLKFADPALACRLIETGDAKLVEGNYWNDTYWGVCRGVGQNRLGELLMKIRKDITR